MTAAPKRFEETLDEKFQPEKGFSRLYQKKASLRAMRPKSFTAEEALEQVYCLETKSQSFRHRQKAESIASPKSSK